MSPSRIRDTFEDIIKRGTIDELKEFHAEHKKILQPTRTMKLLSRYFDKHKPIQDRVVQRDFIDVAVRFKKPEMVLELTILGYYSDSNLINDFIVKSENGMITPIEKDLLNVLREIGYRNAQTDRELKLQEQKVSRFIRKQK